MNKQIQELEKQRQTTKQGDDQNIQKINSQLNSFNDLGLMALPQQYQQKYQRQYDSLIEFSRCNNKKDDNGNKYDKKLMNKKPKIIIDNFREFIPQFFILLNQQKQKSIIRIGKNYQANISNKCSFSYIYRPLSHLKIWNAGEVQSSIIKKFREKFGENRTEEDLCLLMLQYQCDWDQINHYISEYKGQLRKIYLQRDRTKA